MQIIINMQIGEYKLSEEIKLENILILFTTLSFF